MSGAAVAAIAGVWALRGAPDPALDLKTAIDAVNAKRFTAATPVLTGLSKRLPQLADYAGWYLGSSQSELGNYAAVGPALEPVFAQIPRSPLRGRAALLAADALVKMNRTQEAINLLRDHYGETTPPQSDMALGDAYLGIGDKANAAVFYQKVYFGYPQSPAAPRAWAALEKLKLDMGSAYPPAMPLAMLGRAVKMLEAGQNIPARKEFESLIPQLGGAERDLARVRIGVSLYNAKDDTQAFSYLSNLEVAGEADAERLHYLVQAARRLKRLDQMEDLAQRSADLYPKSPWTVDALIAAGNRYLTENATAKFEPLYQSCYEGSPANPDAGLCHWKVTWLHYMRRAPDAVQMLRDHLRSYPASEQAPTALYFLGRLAQQANDNRAAVAYFAETAREYPNVFYAGLSRDRLVRLANIQPSESVTTFLKGVAFPLRSRTHDFDPTPETQSRIQRASLLARAGLKDLAESELRFGADAGEQPPVLAMELAKLLSNGDPAKGMRYIKRYARGYLLMPIDSAPQQFWKLAFPLPFRASLEKFAKQYDVDPFMAAALIRQESEFDPQAVSVTSARGLMQVQPTTGRELARKLKVPYALPKLFQPEYNLQLGTYYFSNLMKQWSGNLEAVLASYNAGPSNAKKWITWGEFREPAEFIETVPITQTRDYIQAVERNAATYREIYGRSATGAAAE